MPTVVYTIKTGLGHAPQDGDANSEPAAANSATTTPTFTGRDIAQRAVDRGSKFTCEQLMDVLSLFERVLREELFAGAIANINLMRLRPRIKGCLTDVHDGFRLEAHKFIIDALPTEQMLNAVKTASAKMLGTTVDEVYIKAIITDSDTGETNIYISND
jgi:hypothetical protein